MMGVKMKKALTPVYFVVVPLAIYPSMRIVLLAAGSLRATGTGTTGFE
ncbi:MAG: hypothetical protein RIR73_2833 [Chloroflexota bacterium]